MLGDSRTHTSTLSEAHIARNWRIGRQECRIDTVKTGMAFILFAAHLRRNPSCLHKNHSLNEWSQFENGTHNRHRMHAQVSPQSRVDLD
jgi:hypothetical protein